MIASTALNTDNLKALSGKVVLPAYDRSKIKAGIVHIGVGNFHRSHQAFYTDRVLGTGVTDWGICGSGLMENDKKIYKALSEQDGLYTLVIKKPDDSWELRVIGSIIAYLFAPENPDALIEKMAEPEIRIISLTITEGGYNYDISTGEFFLSNPVISWDLAHPEEPRSVFGFLTMAMKRRMDRGTGGLTVLSCDNLQQNGDICRKALLSYVHHAEPGLEDWIDQNVTFPNSMVDRITPSATSSDISRLKVRYGISDRSPVVCEPFIQWIIEDSFAVGRPAWEKAGVKLVNDVKPYEKMKIRLLNAGHSLLGFSGSLCGYHMIHETVQDQLLVSLLKRFMDDEAGPTLGTVNGIDMESYKATLIERFGNPAIQDPLSRICSSSSDKIPKFLLPTIRDQLENNGPIDMGTFVLACWCRYLELAGKPGYGFEILDDMGKDIIVASQKSAGDDPLAFIKLRNIFGDLVDSPRFCERYLDLIDRLRKDPVIEVISRLLVRDRHG